MTDRVPLDHLTSDQLDALYGQLDRLTAGEEPGWDPLIEPTPGQWIARWNQANPVERLDVAKHVIDNAATASMCLLMDHTKRLDEQRQAWVQVARVRDVIADMEQITGARHWARILRKAIDEDGTGRAETAAQPEPRPSRLVGLRDEIAAAVMPVLQREWPWLNAENEDAVPAATGATEPHTGLIIQPYRNDRGEHVWVFRCWGTSTCDGHLSLDHHTRQSAERARDRHIAENHAVPTDLVGLITDTTPKDPR